jgi:hypothetical protein
MSRVSFAKLAHAERVFEHAVEPPKPPARTAPWPSSPPPARVAPTALKTAALRAERLGQSPAARPKPKAPVTVFIATKPASGAGAEPVTLTAKALKVTLVLDAAQVAAIDLADGQPAPPFSVGIASANGAVDGRKVTAQVNAKSLRKVIAAIGQHGPDHVAVILQGKLIEGDILAEAGLVAQVKAVPPN